MKNGCWLLLAWLVFVALPLQAAAAAPPAGNAEPDIETLYRQALAALDRGEFGQARSQLEQLVALRPDHAGAWIDLALACRYSGDTDAAIEHLGYVRQRFPLSPELEQRIDLWHAQWLAPPPQPGNGRWQSELQFAAGYDSNANSGLALSQITLTLPDSSVTLPLDPSYRARGDTFTQLDYSGRGPAAGGRLTPFVLLRHRQYAHESDQDQTDLQAGAIYPFAAGPAGRHWQAIAIAQHYRLGGHTLSDSQRLVLQQLRPLADCLLVLGGEIENRQYRQLTLGGTLFWLSGGYGCGSQAGGQTDNQTSAWVRLGREEPHAADRPGGGYSAIEATFQAARTLSGGQRVLAVWQIGHVVDDGGYSPVLANNASRRITRHHLHLALRQPLRGGWDARLSLDLQHQQSNLSLFEQNVHQAMLGLSYRFD